MAGGEVARSRAEDEEPTPPPAASLGFRVLFFLGASPPVAVRRTCILEFLPTGWTSTPAPPLWASSTL